MYAFIVGAGGANKTFNDFYKFAFAAIIFGVIFYDFITSNLSFLNLIHVLSFRDIFRSISVFFFYFQTCVNHFTMMSQLLRDVWQFLDFILCL